MRAATKKGFARQKYLSGYALGEKRATRRVRPRDLLRGLFLVAVLVSLLITSSAQEQPSPVPVPSLPKPPAEQPIPFSHKFHVSFARNCQEGHPNAEPS